MAIKKKLLEFVTAAEELDGGLKMSLVGQIQRRSLCDLRVYKWVKAVQEGGSNLLERKKLQVLTCQPF